MIEFKNVSKTYDDGFKALKNINLRIEEGELVALIGPSGCGKTTTMRMINRLIDPSEGEILVNGENIKKKNPVQLRRDSGYVIQQIGLLPHMTIEDNITIVPKLKKWDKERYSKRVDELLNLVGLDPKTFRKRYPSELSGGQQQRIGVIRGLAADPPIILMDEPFSALDPISREQLQDELVKLQDEINKTIVFVTHDMDEAIKIANRIVIMRDGEIVQVDTPDRILRHPKNDFVRDFIGAERLNKNAGQPVARNLMTKDVAMVRGNRGLAEAFNYMKKSHVDQLFVRNKEGQLEGLITLEQVDKHFEDDTKMVLDVMTTDIKEIVSPDVTLAEVAAKFNGEDVYTLPVVDRGELIGVITRTSMIRGIAEWEHQGAGGDA
ncbi:betaine/proline/choline family ABC transporter ATP-binding protein [Geomicrobium sediminis]|uniref:Quaternary amine transport ATP-binding protein n=1 Tax=Geomicrobium sediminis TaxID=1347788 RepID=A0ABS2PFY8_9BACL|nr:betaine/proline/choline family ABC transporter ATP-binding protein [Geomicrobium sediminis]MBM7634335.1 osmoprotectant transport system ATP-binding protein [Geomicrobium sediminis]